MSLAAVILAAGKGTRMKSSLPKVLHQICGKPMLAHMLDTVRGAGAARIIVVVGYGADKVAGVFGGDVEFVVQKEQLGTAHALMQTEPLLRDAKGQVLVLCGDTPLLRAETLSRLAGTHGNSVAALTLATMLVEEPAGYGRVIRGTDGNILKVVEHRDASPEELAVREVNAGLYCFNTAGLFDSLKQISTDNVQNEYYLPDIIGIFNQAGEKVSACVVEDAAEMQGINDRRQLAAAAKTMKHRILDELMQGGVTIVDPESTFIDAGVTIGQDTTILPFSMIEGSCQVGSDCCIGPGTRLVDATVGDRVTIRNSVVLSSEVRDSAIIGPFAHIRPGTVIGEKVTVGDFVEIKNSYIEEGSKVPHLTYLGDTDIGKKVNVGAGTITCNYNGITKSRTVICDGAFIGSNANLVAPVAIGKNAVVAAGSTITKDVPSEALGVARGNQKNIAGWKTRKKK